MEEEFLLSLPEDEREGMYLKEIGSNEQKIFLEIPARLEPIYEAKMVNDLRVLAFPLKNDVDGKGNLIKKWID